MKSDLVLFDQLYKTKNKTKIQFAMTLNRKNLQIHDNSSKSSSAEIFQFGPTLWHETKTWENLDLFCVCCHSSLNLVANSKCKYSLLLNRTCCLGVYSCLSAVVRAALRYFNKLNADSYVVRRSRLSRLFYQRPLTYAEWNTETSMSGGCLHSPHSDSPRYVRCSPWIHPHTPTLVWKWTLLVYL